MPYGGEIPNPKWQNTQNGGFVICNALLNNGYQLLSNERARLEEYE